MQPKIYPQEEHLITLDQVDKDALYVLERLRTAGHMAYLVGGGVRDLLLKRTPKDYDISTSAKPEEIKGIFRNCLLIGRRFRLAHIRFGRKVLEVATFRSGDIESEELILRDNQWGTAIEDVLRRDFTINGLFYDSFDQSIIDYVDGYPDIKRKYLQTIGQPYLRFKQDPVRMIRLLKFQARFGLEVDEKSSQALLECRSEILKSSPARILEELLRMLESGVSEKFFRLMTNHGLLQLLLPEVSRFLESADGEEIYQFLKEADTIILEKEKPFPDRAVLLSCIAYPLLEKHLLTHLGDRKKKPHLGEIQDATFDMIHAIFGDFLRLPKRLKGKIVALLTSQYRITPFEPKPKRRIHIPRTPEFSLAIEFMRLRSRIEPGLLDIWKEWNEAYEQYDKSLDKKTKPPLKGRKRRKRRIYRKNPDETS